jgi:hypothetical protein
MTDPNNAFLQQVIEQCQQSERRSLSDQSPTQLKGLAESYFSVLESSCCAFHTAMTLNTIAAHYWKSVCRAVDIEFQPEDYEKIEKHVKSILECMEGEEVRSAEAAYYLMIASLTILHNLHRFYPSSCPSDGIVER